MMIVQETGGELQKWIADRIEECDDSDFSPCLTFGILRDGVLVGAYLYNNMRGNDIEITMASSSSKWSTKKVIRHMLGYPFLALNRERLTAVVAHDNAVMQKTLQRVGFSLEGRLRNGFGKKDAMVYGLLKEEFLNSKWMRNG